MSTEDLSAWNESFPTYQVVPSRESVVFDDGPEISIKSGDSEIASVFTGL